MKSSAKYNADEQATNTSIAGDGNSATGLQGNNAGELPSVLTVPELARLLRISRGAAYQAVKEGAVPGVIRVGRSVRVSRDAVLSWLGQGCGSRQDK